jgi:ABC-type antimicrobial peptide transport system permease subunit
MADFNIGVPTFNETPAINVREQHMRQERLLTDLLIVFGSVALGLSAIGIYGMLGYLVIRRTRDIGVRMAIGASRGDIAWLVIIEAILPVAAGLLIGAVISIVAARWAQSLFFGVSVFDPATLLVASALLVATALLAAAIPARRAAVIDPLRALRFE